MQAIDSLIKSIRLSSFVLFFLPLVALLTCLLLTNHLVKYSSPSLFPDGKMESVKVECNLNNGFCTDGMKKVKFHECNKYYIIATYHIDGKAISLYDHGILYRFLIGHKQEGKLNLDANEIKRITENTKIQYVISEPKKIIEPTCVKNSILYPIYKKFTILGELFLSIKESGVVPISKPISPFIYGETSISNIVKRYPISLIFKPLLYLTSLVMLLYWITYKKIFYRIEKTNYIKSKEYFLYFGILSSIFLFFHILFLGMDIESLAFKKLRRAIIILFIFCELLAQCFLAKKIFSLRNILLNYTYRPLIYLKIAFVTTIVLITIVSVLIMIVFDPGHAFNNILEWNYFCFLLLFYLLSAMMWRMKKNN